MNSDYRRDQNSNYGTGPFTVNNNTLGEPIAVEHFLKLIVLPGVALESGLQKLATKAAFSALFNSRARDAQTGCLEGTREEVIEELSRWVESADSKRLCWFYGGAGVGKSAVAQSICEKYLDSRLAASFFYSRNDSSRNSFEPFIPTIAHQLATNPAYENAGLTAALDDIVRTKHGIFDMSWDNQFKWLIQEPLAQIEPAKQDGLPTLIVIDGLDECMGLGRSTSDAIKAQETLLSTIVNALSTHPSLPLHFLIVSRPERTIRTFFRPTPSRPGPVHKPVDMRNFRPQADHDIRLFLEKAFAALPDLHPEAMIEAGWPGEDMIRELIHKSDGHFIYVVTAMKYISQRDDPELKLPQQRLDIILRPDETLYPDLSDLDQLFHHILRQFITVWERMLLPILKLLVTRHHEPSDDTGFFNYINLQVPQRSRHAIATILDLDSRQVATVFSRLHSVFQVPDSEDSDVSFLHTSFSDFLNEKERSRDFYVQPMDRYPYLDLICRRLLPNLADLTYRYQTVNNQVQLLNWETKIEVLSISLWLSVKEVLVAKSSTQAAPQNCFPSDGLLSALNGFDMFQYVNMLLDWKYMSPVNTIPRASPSPGK
ncbi:hypothetical protein V5O48_003675 [Marasmius crinis-equi]|uniref:Nephrocystin 3-like N-terminal domain-containing protein n=1 Tax=Marasmius crinis-equi TaxID=585013 RepID=A0ABR3FS73_9AGAR